MSVYAQNKAKLVKGWCPTLEKPMETGDGWLVRPPIRFGRLAADIAKEIAKLSAKYGNGHLDVSARGNLQLRGVKMENYDAIAAEFADLGFAHDQPLNILINPLAGIDPACNAKVQEIAEKIEQGYKGQNLPPKFFIVIDGGGVYPLSSIPADLYVNSENADVANILDNLAKAKKCDKKPESAEKFTPPLSFVPLNGQEGVFFAALPFGRMEYSQLTRLAELSEEFENSEIRLCPWRMVALPKVAEKDAKNLKNALENLGFITKNGDSRLNIHACPGTPDCSSALGDTRELANDWAQKFPHLKQTVHITGCPKGCAFKGKADITITATGNGYDIEI